MTSQQPLEIRAEIPDDHLAVDEIVRAAFLAEFGSTSEVGLVRTLRERRELIEDLTLVAVEGATVVGYVAMSEVTVDHQRVRALGLAPVAVAPDRQGSGIGSTLIPTSLAIAERAGWQFVVLLGHAEYYPRFGFVPARDHGLTGDYGNGDGWMVRALAATPLPTGHVRYCSAFHS
jgi:predicted N-acetyltransferase YhbS